MLEKLILLWLKIFKPKRKKFARWAELEELAHKAQDSLTGELEVFPVCVNKHVSISLSIPLKYVEKLSWQFVLSAYFVGLAANSPKIIPLLQPPTKKDDRLSWEYEGRDWFYWSHLLAKNYGWSLDQINNLDVDVALAHIQEILVDDQLDREFIWTTTEIAYPYNKATKQSVFRPLTRPYFMLEKAKPIKVFKIPKKLMPMGDVHDLSGMEAHVQKQVEIQKSNANRDDETL